MENSHIQTTSEKQPSNQQPISASSANQEDQISSVPQVVEALGESSTKKATSITSEKKEDVDSAMDTGEACNDVTSSSEKLNNGHATPTSDSLSSPPLCNGNHSDNDSLLAESSKANSKLVNGTTDAKSDINGSAPESKVDPKAGGDTINSKTFTKNGCINVLEKMFKDLVDNNKKGETITDNQIQGKLLLGIENAEILMHIKCRIDLTFSCSLSEHVRHKSGDSVSSQASTTQQEVHANHVTTKPADIPTYTEQQPTQQSSDNGSHKEQPVDSNHLSNTLTVQTEDNSPTSLSVKSSSPRSTASSNKSSSRKRRRSDSSIESRASAACSDKTLPHKCFWADCPNSYATCSLLRRHVSDSHTHEAGTCQWAGCDKVERKRWALVSHVNVSQLVQYSCPLLQISETTVHLSRYAARLNPYLVYTLLTLTRLKLLP